MAGLIVLKPVADGRLYPVQSGDHIWHVDASSGECDCPAFWFQSSKRKRLCKHSRAVARHLAQQGACPVCKGRGWLVSPPVMHYVKADGARDDQPLACVGCGGSGKSS